MSVGDGSRPEIREENVEVNQGDIPTNLADVSTKLDEVLAAGRSSNLQETSSEDFDKSESASVQLDEIGAVGSYNQGTERRFVSPDMSADVESGQTGFVLDGVDNLHGLSIARSSGGQHLDEEVKGGENHLDDIADGKTERVNPFNSGMNQSRPKPLRYTEPMPKFLSLDSFGSESPTPTNLLEDDLSKLQLGRDEESGVNAMTPASPKFNGGMIPGHSSLHNFSPTHVGLDQDIIPPTVPPPPPSDPWVRLSPEIAPKLEEHMPSISPKMEQKVTPEKTLNSTPDKTLNSNEKQQNALCLDGELKKAPAIDPSVSLSPMVLDIPGPCEPEDLIEGIIFSANYLGTTQLVSNRNPAKNARMFQAQEAVNRIKAPDGESQPTVEVDLFISTTKIKILNADTQETMMSHTLRSISYIADIGDLLVVMAKRHPSAEEQNPDDGDVMRKEQAKKHRIICHVLSSSDSHLIAESIGQCFNVAYQQFLQSNCIEPQSLTQADFNQLLDTQEMYHDDLVHYSKQENVKEIWVEKKNGETMGIAIVESGWGSIIPTVILANLQHGSPIERNGKFSIGDQIMSINGTSLVGLPLQTCHSIIKGLRSQTLVKINIVSCPPVVSVLIKRPNLKHQLGFSVQNGIICSLMRGGIAERGGVRVGHRIIEINNQSVVATPHDKIVQMLVTSVGEIQMKTMPAAMYRLLTGQEQPIYL